MYEGGHRLKSISKNLHVYIDVMHVDGKMFKVSVTEPLNLTLQFEVENEERWH